MVQQPGMLPTGFSLLTATDPTAVITGFGFSSASIADQPLAETFFAVRARPSPRIGSAGSAALGPYVVDKGFEGAFEALPQVA
jgi:hypothetical protein